MENDVAKGMGGFNARNVKQWFTGLVVGDQKALLDDLQGVFDQVKGARIERLRAELAVLMGNAPARPAVKITPKEIPARKVAGKRGTPKGTKVAPKYIDRATGTTWAGRGVKPAWVVAHLKKGGKLDDLLISKKRGK